MKPGHQSKPLRFKRRCLHFGATGLLLVAVLLGCKAPAFRSQSPEKSETKKTGQVTLVGEIAVPFNMNPMWVESVGLITGLNGKGSDPVPSPQRAALLAEMQTQGVHSPNQMLASLDTSMVVVRGALRPGIRKGDRFDVEVRVLGRDETKSLRGGWLMESRLAQHAVLDNQVRDGKTVAFAQGAVLVDPSATPESAPELLRRGVVLGGGVSRIDRPMGLVLKPDYQYVHYCAQVEAAINRRFHKFEHGIKAGVAKAHDDKRLTLELHPRYKDNVDRYVNVVRALPLKETAAQQMDRISLLERQLMDPVTTATAAIRLEALGKDGIPALKKGLESSDPEVRFYSAEALAYLDETAAVDALATAAQEVPAFRAYALTALSAMDDFSAYEALSRLLHVPSAETRYGAFRSLWAMNELDPLVRGERLADFSYHVLKTSGPAMVHVTRSYRAEVILFGEDQVLKTPVLINAGEEILVTSREPGQITVSRFSTRDADQQRTIPATVDGMIRAIVEVGGGYPDVVQALQQAKSSGALESRFEMDALPRANLRYRRKSPQAEEESPPVEEGMEFVAANPLPELFATGDNKKEKPEKSPPPPEKEEEPGFMKRIFRKLKKDDA